MPNNKNDIGSIRICRVQNLGRIKADVKIAAVRELSKPIDGALVCPELAADGFMSDLKAAAKADNTWNPSKFVGEYVPLYMRRLCLPEARQTLNRIYKAVKAGKTVAIACYCADEFVCHRVVIAGLFQGLGLEVTGVKADYSAYYDMWRETYKPIAKAVAA